MRSIGIICEYNPFHNGHARQLRLAREAIGEDCALVCLMSGNYVQRGEPAIFPKALRAEAALRCGADLVLELPLTAALSSAEGFAAGGVSILTALGCGFLCYGTESDDNNLIMSTAKANLDPAFDALLRAELTTGCSYPAARQKAIERLGAGAGLCSPNDILAVEYCKAILRQGSPLRPLPVRRTGAYHAETLDPEAPSATALRASLETARRGGHWPPAQGTGIQCCHSARSEESASPVANASAWHSAVPACLRDLYASAPIHTMGQGERAVLAILRTLPDTAFEALPFGAEGLWSKFMKNCRSLGSVAEIIEATKSKRYTRTRIQRMLLCAVLGLTGAELARTPSYVRVLGFNNAGRAALREMKKRLEAHAPAEPAFALINAGEIPPDPACYALEVRAADLYSLFSADGPRPAGEEASQRVRYLPSAP